MLTLLANAKKMVPFSKIQPGEMLAMEDDAFPGPEVVFMYFVKLDSGHIVEIGPNSEGKLAILWEEQDPVYRVSFGGW